MNKNYEPIPPQILHRMRVMQHDLFKVKENLAIGRVRPEDHASLERVLAARIELLEAEVHARLLDEARSRNARFKMT